MKSSRIEPPHVCWRKAHFAASSASSRNCTQATNIADVCAATQHLSWDFTRGSSLIQQHAKLREALRGTLTRYKRRELTSNLLHHL